MLAADVGGTYARVGVVHYGAGAPEVAAYRKYRCADYPTLTAIFADFLGGQDRAGITHGAIACAGYVLDDAVINTNLRSTWLCSKAAVRSMMRKRYGRIVNIASISGIVGNGGQTNYSASKAGIIGLTKALAREVASRNITVNAVAPGFVLTDLTSTLPEDITKKLNENIPLGRWGTIDDIANAATFLVMDASSYITGHVLVVDGGMAM